MTHLLSVSDIISSILPELLTFHHLEFNFSQSYEDLMHSYQGYALPTRGRFESDPVTTISRTETYTTTPLIDENSSPN
jgi:hypothetical protein